MILTFEFARKVLGYQSYKADATELTAEDLAIRDQVEKAFPILKYDRLQSEYKQWVMSKWEQGATLEDARMLHSEEPSTECRREVHDEYKAWLVEHNKWLLKRRAEIELMTNDPELQLEWETLTGNKLLSRQSATCPPLLPPAIQRAITWYRDDLELIEGSDGDIDDLDAAMAELGFEMRDGFYMLKAVDAKQC